MTDFVKPKLPFNIVSSSANTGYITEISSGFKPSVDIVGHHQDTYAGLENEPLQSPFTREHVGGNQHRHVPLNKGSDNDFNRPEAFKIKPESGQLKIYGPDFEDVNKPRAQNWLGAKSPINIANIQTNGNLPGNFENNYQVVQTVGRRITNNLIVDGFVASGNLTTQFISGAHNYSLPDIVNNSNSIIVERFNAPGGKEESSRGALDRAGEELSPNNSLTTRNIKVRQPFYSQLTQHSPQFGSGSTTNLLPATGNINTVSIHKINRNTRKEIRFDSSDNPANTNKYDNYWIQHAIPASNFGYSWITASVLNNPHTIGTGSFQFAFTASLANTGEINLDTQTMLGSLSASQQSYGTREQIRTAEHPVAQKMRESNIISVENVAVSSVQRNGKSIAPPRRSPISTNFKVPPVTIKNHPIIQEILFSGAIETPKETTLVYTFKNNSTWFANEDLNKRLSLFEKEVKFYKLLVDSKNLTVNSLIQDINSLSFKETLYPRELNTFLSGTRSRTEYILDQPGFDRDGYDRQLGTQRVFWRDNQEDRRRSPNSSGGHINSLGYSSLEESGSDFSENISGSNSRGVNGELTLSSSYIQNININNGLFNSILFLENSSSEIELYQRQFKVRSVESEKFLNIRKSVSTGIRKSYGYLNNSEQNNIFIDSFEQNVFNEKKNSIGALYRNTSYKNMLTFVSGVASKDELFFINEEDQIDFNPRPKYISFIGGVELNTSSYVQDNSINSFISTSGSFGVGYSFAISGSDIYYSNTGQYPNITGNLNKYDLLKNEWSIIEGIDFIPQVVRLSGSYLYLFGSYNDNDPINWAFKKYHTINKTIEESFPVPFTGSRFTAINTAIYSGSDWYIGGQFWGDIAANNRGYVKWNNSLQSWTTPYPGLAAGTQRKVYDFIAKDQYVYAAVEGRVQRIDTTTDTFTSIITGLTGPNPSAPPATISAQVLSLYFSGSDLYFSGDFTKLGAATLNRIGKWDGSTVTNMDTGSTSSVVRKFVMSNDGILYGGGIPFSLPTGFSGGFIKYNGDQSWTTITPDIGSTNILDMNISGNNIYFTTQGTLSSKTNNSDKINNIGYYNIQQDLFYGLTDDIEKYPNNYFSQSFTQNDFIFSTLDNGLINQKTKTPSYDSVDDYYQTDIYQIAKDYSVVPEFKISEHIKYYVSEGGNYQSENNSLLSLDGAASKYSSADSPTSSFNQQFFKDLIYTDKLVKQRIEADYEDKLGTDSVSITVKGVKKLLPYNGFYPQERTIQLGNLYGDYINNMLSGGVYTINNINEKNLNLLITASNSSSNNFRHINDIIKFKNKNYIATNIFNNNKIYIYSSSIDSEVSFEQSPAFTIDYTNIFDFKFININDSLLSLYYSTDTSSISIANTFNGETWLTSSLLSSSNNAFSTDVYVSGAVNLDVYYEKNSNKIFLICANPDFTDTPDIDGKISLYTCSYSSFTTLNSTVLIGYSPEKIIATGSDQLSPLNDVLNIGTSISFVSASNSYHLYYTSPIHFSTLRVVSSSDGGETWSNNKKIYNTSVGQSDNFSTGIKSLFYNNKIYVFCSLNEYSPPFVISSSVNCEWAETENETNLKFLSEFNSSPRSNYSRRIDAKKSNDEKLIYFSYSNCNVNFGIQIPTYLTIGTVKDDEIVEKVVTFEYPSSSLTTSSYNSIVSIISEDQNNIPYYRVITDYLTGSSKYIVSYDLKSYIKYSLYSENIEKRFKQAAIEPIIGPGILYNTIKSGIAVDWPCTTGSNISIQPYGSDSIVNAYYPQSFKMFEQQNNNISFNAYGNLKSNIDYRVDFEKLIFPDDIFPVKSVLTGNLEEIVLSALPEDSQLSNFISGCYIYGGYEPYTSPVDFSDYSELGPKRFSVPFVYRKENAKDNGLYSLAMSNFLAETVRFFLQTGSLTTFVSKQDSSWGQFISGTTYYMDIVMSKTPDLVMMEAYHDSKHPIGPNGEKMNGRYFGYPVNKTNKQLWSADSDSLFTAEEARLIHNDPAYAPYTPPYFEGEARLTLSYTPSSSFSAKFSDVISNLIIDAAYSGLKSAHTASDAYINKMAIDSSLKIDGKSFATITDSDGVSIQDPSQLRWTISTKFETPILDFSSQQLTPYENNYSKTSGYGRGMWSGYGEIPKENKGITVSLEESQQFIEANKIFSRAGRARARVQSLLQKVGFENKKQKIGQLANVKLIKEAVMIIPYIDEGITAQDRSRKHSGNTELNSNLTSLEKELGIQFIGVDKNIYNRIITNNIESSIKNTVDKMKQFIVPPQLDYTKYPESIDPFVAYIVEFTHELTQQDLADIWQGVSPKISKIAELKDVNITHKTGENEFFHTKKLPDNLKFMIFKIKQKGEFDYFKVTDDSEDDELNKKFTPNIPGERLTQYGYNWPYDFFSLVEMVKIDVEVIYKKRGS
jgi:hypothetical protein